MKLISFVSLIRNDEIVDNAFDCCSLLIEITLVHLNAFLASKVNKTVAKILLNLIFSSTHCVSLDVLVADRIGVGNFGVRAL